MKAETRLETSTQDTNRERLAEQRALERLKRDELAKMKAEDDAKAAAERAERERKEREATASKLDADIKARRDELSTAEGRAEKRVAQIVGDLAEVARIGREINRLTEERRAVLRKDAPRWADNATEGAAGRFHSAIKRVLESRAFPESAFFGWFNRQQVAFAR